MNNHLRSLSSSSLEKANPGLALVYDKQCRVSNKSTHLCSLNWRVFLYLLQFPDFQTSYCWKFSNINLRNNIRDVYLISREKKPF